MRFPGISAVFPRFSGRALSYSPVQISHSRSTDFSKAGDDPEKVQEISRGRGPPRETKFSCAALNPNPLRESSFGTSLSRDEYASISVRADFQAHFQKFLPQTKPKVSQLCASSGGLSVLGGRFHPFPLPMYGLNMLVKLVLLDRIDINPKRKSSEQNFGPHCLHCFVRKLEGREGQTGGFANLPIGSDPPRIDQ